MAQILVLLVINEILKKRLQLNSKKKSWKILIFGSINILFIGIMTSNE